MFENHLTSRKVDDGIVSEIMNKLNCFVTVRTSRQNDEVVFSSAVNDIRADGDAIPTVKSNITNTFHRNNIAGGSELGFPITVVSRDSCVCYILAIGVFNRKIERQIVFVHLTIYQRFDNKRRSGAVLGNKKLSEDIIIVDSFNDSFVDIQFRVRTIHSISSAGIGTPAGHRYGTGQPLEVYSHFQVARGLTTRLRIMICLILGQNIIVQRLRAINHTDVDSRIVRVAVKHKDRIGRGHDAVHEVGANSIHKSVKRQVSIMRL